MQIFRLNKNSNLRTKAIIISHMDLDGVMSAHLCDLAYREFTGYTKDQVQVVGDYSPEPRTTLGCLKQVLYKLPVEDEVSIFVLDRSNISSDDINKLLADGWIKPRWKITCIDHHNTNFKKEEYERTPIRVNQIVNDKNSAAMNVVDFFEGFGYKFNDNVREVARLTSIYDRFAWLTEDISEEDERDAKYLNRVCGINHRNEFIKMVEEKSIEEILKIGENASIIISMMVKKLYQELVDDNNDFLIHRFSNNKGKELNVVFIRRSIEYMYVSELSEYIFNENNSIHVIVYIDEKLGAASLRSRESGKFLNIADMISSIGLKGGGHPGAGGYYAYRLCDKKELVDRLYYNQSLLLANVVDDMRLYFESSSDNKDLKYIEGDYFYGMDESYKKYLESLSNK